MHEMFIDELFNEFQVKQIEEINIFIIGLITQNRFEEAKSAFALANKIIKLPYTISKEDDVKARMVENLKRFQSNFLRKSIDV